jgi:hypothetical protein
MPMVRIVAYTYEAGINCPTCARRAWQAGRLVASGQDTRLDEHGMPADGLIDREGNPVHPVFDTDEFGLGEPCDTCHDLIAL